MIFLLLYDRAMARLIDVREYSDSDGQRAAAERLEAELDAQARGLDLEVVALEAASIGVLKETHRSYFSDLNAVIERLEDKGR
jgi:hypothetical protein